MEDYYFKDKTHQSIPKNSEDLIKKNYDVAFMVLVSFDFTSLKLFYVEKTQANLQLREEVMISTTEIIDGFDIHKSLNYVLVTTRDGTVNLFSLKTREFVFKYCLEMRIKCNYLVKQAWVLIPLVYI